MGGSVSVANSVILHFTPLTSITLGAGVNGMELDYLPVSGHYFLDPAPAGPKQIVGPGQ